MVDKIVILLSGWLGLFSLYLSADSNETKATIAQMRGVSLEAAFVARSMQYLYWQNEHLPPNDQTGTLLVVGQDNCLFKERLVFLFDVAGLKVQGRQMQVESCESLEEATQIVEENHKIMFVVVLDSASDQWDAKVFSKRKGLVVYGQGETFKQKGMSMYSYVQNNRIKVSVNLKKLKNKKIQVGEELLSRNQMIFTGG